MRQAIATKYLGPTNHKDSRVKAICDAGAVTIPWDYALDPAQNHEKAATALAWKLGWLDTPYNQTMQGGSMPQSSPYAYCFVMVPRPKLESGLNVKG